MSPAGKVTWAAVSTLVLAGGAVTILHGAQAGQAAPVIAGGGAVASLAFILWSRFIR